MAIGRLGASENALLAFDLEVNNEKPLDFREIVPKESFKIDPETGELTAHTPESIKFKDAADLKSKNGEIRPVAPFLEVFAVTDKSKDALVPLTTTLLKEAGYTLDDIHWDVELGNIKIFRRTNDENDKMYAKLSGIADHVPHSLLATCPNFLPDKTLPLGKVQFIKPNDAYPEVRFRFTPAAGKVYGSSLHRILAEGAKPTKDPVITSKDLVLYDIKKGKWHGYVELADTQPQYTMPAQIFAGYSKDNGDRVSWGYLDDECDGYVTVTLKHKDGNSLSAKAHISAGPPAFAPDTLPVRVVSDELEQILLSPEVEGEVSIEEAEDIVRRALETVRLMNTAIMNGNPVNGQYNVASTMVRQNTNDFGRYYEPIMATSIVDNLAIRALHDRVFSGLSTGAAPWFGDVLRRPEEIGDLSSPTLRKMPALMRGADGRSLTLTHRQINMVIKAAASAMFRDQQQPAVQDRNTKAKPLNLTAQLHYRGTGNPYSVLPRTAISNCFPGLEFDFRNLWRRAFNGIVLIENNNYVIDADDQYKHLIGHRLVGIDGKPTMVITTGPVFPEQTPPFNPLITKANPNGSSFMEWSNSLAHVLQHQGKEAKLSFTKEKSFYEIVVTAEDLKHDDHFLVEKLTINHFFEKDTAVISETVVRPGEMTQGLCAPWQNDYRECACYYWAASRPDFVNVVPNEKGLSSGDSWMAKKRTGEYIPDNRTDTRLLSYDDLFINWQGELSFIVKGNDALESPEK